MIDVLKDFYEAISIIDLIFLIIKIREGSKVNTEIIANNIAIPVNTPK